MQQVGTETFFWQSKQSWSQRKLTFSYFVILKILQKGREGLIEKCHQFKTIGTYNKDFFSTFPSYAISNAITLFIKASRVAINNHLREGGFPWNRDVPPSVAISIHTSCWALPPLERNFRFAYSRGINSDWLLKKIKNRYCSEVHA